jgi:hypothetical protein
VLHSILMVLNKARIDMHRGMIWNLVNLDQQSHPTQDPSPAN